MKEIIEEVTLDEDTKDRLNRAVNTYFEKNQEYQSASDTRKIYNENLKTLLEECHLTKYVSDTGIKASLSVSNKPTFNEDEMIPFLKQFNIDGLIKTREYVDMNVLEDAIYHNQIEASRLTPFKEDHLTSRLTVTKPKVLNE